MPNRIVLNYISQEKSKKEAKFSARIARILNSYEIPYSSTPSMFHDTILEIEDDVGFYIFDRDTFSNPTARSELRQALERAKESKLAVV